MTDRPTLTLREVLGALWPKRWSRSRSGSGKSPPSLPEPESPDEETKVRRIYADKMRRMGDYEDKSAG